MALSSTKKTTWYTPTVRDNHLSDTPLRVELRPIKMGAFLELSQIAVTLAQRQKTTPATQNVQVAQAQELMELVSSARPILEHQVVSLTNYTVDGLPGTIADLLDDPALNELVIEILSQLLILATPSDVWKKNSPPASVVGV